MIREVITEAVQKKFFLMFFTCVIYIIGLFAYFNDLAILFSFLLLVVGVVAILKNYVSAKLVLFWYLIFFFAFFNAGFRSKPVDELYSMAPEQSVIEGQIASIPAKDNLGREKFFFNVKRIKDFHDFVDVNSKTLVTAECQQDKQKLNIGDSYSFKGKLRTPFEATNPSQFDYSKYLRNFNVFTVFYADGCEFESVPTSLKWKFLQLLNNVRNDIISSHSKYLKSPNLELLGGIVFGDDAVSAPEELKQSFVNSGLLHILAASGMNVALIYGIWFFILRRLRVSFNFTVISGIFVVILYTMMTGMGPSIIRAAIMLVFILIGKLIDRDADSLSLLSFVCLLMLIFNPSYINDVGFQLSFIVTFGLLLTAPLVFDRVKFMPNWLSGAIFIPMIAQIWIAPIQMFYFNSFSLYSIFANILVLPFLTVVSFGGFISSVLALIKPLSDGVCYVFDFVLNPALNSLVWISDYFSSLPNSLIQTIQPSVFQLFVYYVLIFSVLVLFKYELNKKFASVPIIVFLVLLLSCIPFKNNSLEILAFDVQNADAFLIKTSDSKYFIIDSGKQGFRSSKTQAKYIILEYLRDKGIRNIEGLILTHFDSDHAGGAVDLINNLNIKIIYVNSLYDDSKIAKNIYKVGGSRVKKAKNGEVIYQSGKDVIKNYIADFKDKKLENENSVITLVSKSDYDVLFMGDAGIMAFNKIKKQLPLKIEGLKVGHHGAKNVIDKNMLNTINPDFALISTGLNNYGHPNGVTLNLLEQKKVKTYRTDRHNAIKVVLKQKQDKQYSEISSFQNGKFVLFE